MKQLIPTPCKLDVLVAGVFFVIYCLVLNTASRSNFLRTQTCKNSSFSTTERVD